MNGELKSFILLNSILKYGVYCVAIKIIGIYLKLAASLRGRTQYRHNYIVNRKGLFCTTHE